MIRSLLVAAKVKCAELGLNTGLTHCDRFLSHVDLICTLVNADCSSLIPRIDKDDCLDDHTLRKLRDFLTEKEQWIIALDVSTKSGLDRQGVWAAWSTACLKVGYYQRARDKFTHCLDDRLSLATSASYSIEDFDDWCVVSSQQHQHTSRSSKDPPLMAEILQILNKKNYSYGHYESQRQNQHQGYKCARAQEIFNRLNSLNAISLGQYSVVGTNNGTTSNSNKLSNFRYQESLYYLFMYASQSSILKYFVRHCDYEKCLEYIFDNDVDTDLFVNGLFLPTLRKGSLAKLYQAMSKQDPSLSRLKKYLIYTCHKFETKKYYHTLLEIQLFMKDYVRAAMTCIRFYISDAITYQQLSWRNHLLIEAQQYLESQLDVLTTSHVSNELRLNQVKTDFVMDPAEIDRHINTISRQMEIAKFLANRELEGKSEVGQFVKKLSLMEQKHHHNNENVPPEASSASLPTLFGNQQEKTHLAVLAILCGRDVEEGFGIAFRIMQGN